MDLHCLRNICTYFDHAGHLGARMAFTLKYKPGQRTVLNEVFSSCANSFTLYIYIYIYILEKLRMEKGKFLLQW